MSKILAFTVFLLIVAMASGQTPAQQLSPQQAEVWKGEENFSRYLEEKDLQNFMSLWDEHFTGWPDYEPLPIHKPQIESIVREEFQSEPKPGPTLPAPKPEAVTLFGDVAVTDYFWPEADKSSPSIYRISHTWQKGREGWHIIGGMSCEVPRGAGTPAVAASSGQPSSIVSAQAPGDETLSAKVDEAVVKLRQEQRIPGTSLAVVRDGKIIKAAGYGLANIELNVPVTPQTIFQSGSIGKQFTATAVMMLVEEGKVGLDDSITKYFPEAPPAWKAVKIRHMLTHTSGLPDIFGEAQEGTYTKGILDFRRDYTEEEMVRKFVTLPLDFQPGEKWNYSNTGYMLLGVMIRRVTGQFYGDFLQQRIFLPLGMTATRIISEEDIVPNRSSGYRILDDKLKNQEWVAPSLNTTADGGLYTNVLDLAKWDAALYTEKLLKKSSLEQIWTPVKLNSGKTSPDPYGFGWQINNANGHRVVWHTGGNQGFFVIISRYLDDRLTIIAMSNLDEFHSDAVKMAGAVASIYIPETAGANPVKDW